MNEGIEASASCWQLYSLIMSYMKPIDVISDTVDTVNTCSTLNSG